MRLRNLFMILLLCMTVGVFSACTGDDGETGPQGPQGPPGEPGATTDAEPETSFYPFLKSWGSESGEVACGDDLLEGSGPLPGGDDALNHKLSAPAPAPQVNNNPTIVECGNAFFSGISVDDVNTLGDLNLATAAFTANEGIVFVPTGKGSAKDTMNVPSTEFNPATAVTTTKTFIGGMVFADLNTGGDVNEPGERQDLYSQCGVGTAPSYVMGTYRAVRIVQSTQPYKDGSPVVDDSDPPVPVPGPKTTTTKVCVVLDAHPGATKCLVDVVTVPANAEKDGRSIAVYDGMNLNTVVPMDKLHDTDTGTTVTADIFTTSDSDDDFTNIENICSLFGEGGTATAE